MKLKKQLYSIYAKHTKQSLQVIGEWAPTPGGSPAAPLYLNQHRRKSQALCSARPRCLGTVDTRGHPVPCGAFSSIPGRHSLDASTLHLQQPELSPDIAQGPLGHRITPS